MPAIAPAIAAWWGGLGLGTQAAIGGLGATAVGAGVSTALAPHSNLTIPPPPGAAMVDPAGSTASAALRRRQADAGGLQSTVGAGAQPGAAASYGNAATSGQKQLLGA